MTGFSDGREQRLLARGVSGDNRPFMQRIFGGAEKSAGKAIENFTNPDAARERRLVNDTEKLQAFQKPDIFTAPVSPATKKGGQVERLLSMTPMRRLEEFQMFLSDNIPEAVRGSYSSLFALPLGEADLFDYEQQREDGRINTLLSALAILNGTPIPGSQNPLANELAQEILLEKNNNSEAPGTLFRLYESWLDSKPGMSETDATTPELLLKRDSGIPDQLRGALKNLIEESVQRTWLKNMYEQYRSHQTDDNLLTAQARADKMQLAGSVEKRRIEQESRGLVDNILNADPRIQIALAAAGAYGVYRIFKAKSSLGRWAIGGVLGYYAYDRFLNGNQNALNDMGNGLQKFVKFNGDMLKNLAREAGLPIPRGAQDKFQLMSDFILQNKRSIEGHEAITSMDTLANVKLGELFSAYTPYMDGGELGGDLMIYDDKDEGNDATAINLRTAIKKQLQLSGVNGTERELTFKYLKSNKGGIGKALAHVGYMLAKDDIPNIARSERIEKALEEFGTYDNMPSDLKREYMEISFQGKKMAESSYKGSSLVDVIAKLQANKEKQKALKPDPALEIPDPKTPGRLAEFGLIESTQNVNIPETKRDAILEDGGVSENDTIEFLRNCEFSGIVSADAAFELHRRFDIVRRTSTNLGEALQTIEKMKYAVLVQSTKQETPLSKEDILLLTGPDDRTAASILSTVTGFLGRLYISVPRDFSSVSSLADIQSLLTEPWVGNGPVQSQGEGFKRLQDRFKVYNKKLSDLRTPDIVTKDMASRLPTPVVDLFGDKDKLSAFLKTLLTSSNYNQRLNRAEQHLSQRMANALGRTMRLTHERDGFGRFDELGVTPTEQKNLATEFDRLFTEVIGDPFKDIFGMWQGVEDIDTYRKFDLAAIESHDYKEQMQRLEMVRYARDLGILYALYRASGRKDEVLRLELIDRVVKIYDKIETQKKTEIDARIKKIPPTLNEKDKKAMQLRNLYEAQVIDNMTSYRPVIFTELDDILKLLEHTRSKPVPSIKEMYKDRVDDFPPDFDAGPRFDFDKIPLPSFEDYKKWFDEMWDKMRSGGIGGGSGPTVGGAGPNVGGAGPNVVGGNAGPNVGGINAGPNVVVGGNAGPNVVVGGNAGPNVGAGPQINNGSAGPNVAAGSAGPTVNIGGAGPTTTVNPQPPGISLPNQNNPPGINLTN